MLILRYHFLLALFIALPGFALNEENMDFPTAKHRITLQDLQVISCKIKERQDDANFLVTILFPRLTKFINKELYSNQWEQEVKKAYEETLIFCGPTLAEAIRISHPIDAIIKLANLSLL
jgi:hypothetical protein